MVHSPILVDTSFILLIKMQYGPLILVGFFFKKNIILNFFYS